MGSWTLGRVGLDVVANSVDAPASWEVSGDDIRFSGVLRASSVNDAGFLRIQLNGLLDNPDEPWVPFTWTEDPYAWDTLVRVNSVKVGTVPLSLTTGWFPFEVSMSRLPGTANAPVVESRLGPGGLRVNSHSIAKASTVPWWATPTDATSDRLPGATTSLASATRTGSGGSVKVQYTADGTLLYDATPTMQLAPADWYDMAAKIELTPDSGTTYRATTGRQVVNLPTVWRLSNDLVRVTYGGGDGLITVQHYSSVASAWQNAKTYKLATGISASVTPSAIGAFQTLTVLRNSPECVSIRLSAEHLAAAVPVNVDLTLRRGSLYLEGVMTRAADALSATESASVSSPFGIYRNTNEAGTTHTSGVHATAADAGTGGGKYVLTSPTATNVDTTIGGLAQGTGVNTFQFMVGYEPSGAAGPDTFTNQVYAYFAAVNERQSVVQR